MSSDILIAQRIYSVLMAIEEVKRLYFNIISFLNIIMFEKKKTKLPQSTVFNFNSNITSTVQLISQLHLGSCTQY